jgi:ATP-dependent DNA helicase RecG
VALPQVPFLKRVAGERVIDLAWHLPFALVDRRVTPTIAAAVVGDNATVEGGVILHVPSPRRGAPYRIKLSDETGFIDLVYFNMAGGYLKKLFPVGERRIVSGKIKEYNGVLQMAPPDLVLEPAERDKIGKIQAVYRGTAGLPAPTLASIIYKTVEALPDLPEWIDAALAKREGWPVWRRAMQLAHNPQTATDIETQSPPKRRLAYDELLASQLTLALLQESRRRERGQAIIGTGFLQKAAMAKIGFALTNAQVQALAEIKHDMESPRRMVRLLQGDVGSGKTIVALLAMLQAVEAGGQAALMAPTEILARQHYLSLGPICRSVGVHCDLLLGKGRGRERTMTLAGLASGTVQIVIGTHALVQEAVAFKDLRFAVIDEQHRFGVDNRLNLTAKGQGVDTLLMTATPIPRTLTLTMYGDMAASRLNEKPPGRQPIDTRTISLDRLDEVLAGVGRQIEAGARVYWVCPLVEESELSDLAAAKQRAITLGAKFGVEKVGLIHGKMPAVEKAATMEAFASGRLAILVATTVIEVGINVPEATLMIIEHAERYGLSQLHQLRGRVGRGTGQSRCLLLFTPNIGQVAQERLKIIRQSEDGFYLAEEDLRLRGGGEMLGTRQSGEPEFHFADVVAHSDLVEIAEMESRLIIERDPDLQTEKGQALRILLYLFERDQAVKYLRSG